MKICDRSLLRRRPIDDDEAHMGPVRVIVAAVRARGDAALREYTTQFDRVTLNAWPHPNPALGLELVSGAVLGALRAAAERVEQFHRRQPITSWMTSELGGVLGQHVSALRRVGV